MADLERPNFIERSPSVVEAEIIALWEEVTGKPLYPAQAERLLLNLLTYREALVRTGIQYAAEQNLVNYAVGVNLDHLGALLDVVRLPAAAAQTTLRFTLPAPLGSSLLIPAGTRASQLGSLLNFATVANLTIAAGQLTGDVSAIASETGIAGNGFTPGALNFLLDPIPGRTLAVTNLATTADGADTESDDRFRARIKLAPNKFSVAGSVGAYQYHTLSVSQTIIDAAITNPSRVVVNVYPLTADGPAQPALLDAVNTALQPDKVRPLTDIVSVIAPTTVGYTIAANVVLLTSAESSALQTQLNDAIAAYVAERKAGLGRDIVRSQIVANLSLPGVYSVSITSPATDLAIAANEWANCTSTTINITGTNAG